MQEDIDRPKELWRVTTDGEPCAAENYDIVSSDIYVQWYCVQSILWYVDIVSSVAKHFDWPPPCHIRLLVLTRTSIIFVTRALEHFPLVEHQLWQSFRFIHPCYAKTIQCKISLLFFIANWAPEMAQFATEESGPENEGQHMSGPNKVGGNWPESVGSPLPYLGIPPRVNLNWDKHSLKRLLCAFTICSWARLQARPPKQCCYNAKFVIFYYHIVAAPSTAVFLCRILAYVS